MSDVIQQVVGNLKFIQEAARLNGLTKTWTKAQESIDALQALQSGEADSHPCQKVLKSFWDKYHDQEGKAVQLPVGSVTVVDGVACAMDFERGHPDGNHQIYLRPHLDTQPIVTRNDLIELLISTRTQSEGVTADLIIKLLSAGKGGEV
jgi:hypothetical protein